MLWLATSWSRALSWRQPDVHLGQIPGIGGEGPKENSGCCCWRKWEVGVWPMGCMMFYYRNANRSFFKKYEKSWIQKDLPKFRL